LDFDAERAAPKRQHVPLTLKLAATEDRVALGTDGLFKFRIRIAAGVEGVIAHDARQPPEDDHCVGARRRCDHRQVVEWPGGHVLPYSFA
jgi:hypothetical protein